MASKAAVRRKAAEDADQAAEDERRRVMLAAGLDPDMPEGHEAHHWHARGNSYECSCGRLHGGAWSFIPDARLWSDDPAEVAQAVREQTDWQAWIICYRCGESGVTAEDVAWPPRTLLRSVSVVTDLHRYVWVRSGSITEVIEP